LIITGKILQSGLPEIADTIASRILGAHRARLGYAPGGQCLARQRACASRRSAGKLVNSCQ
jgi:hypothetical protein